MEFALTISGDRPYWRSSRIENPKSIHHKSADICDSKAGNPYPALSLSLDLTEQQVVLSWVKFNEDERDGDCRRNTTYRWHVVVSFEEYQRDWCADPFALAQCCFAEGSPVLSRNSPDPSIINASELLGEVDSKQYLNKNNPQQYLQSLVPDADSKEILNQYLEALRAGKTKPLLLEGQVKLGQPPFSEPNATPDEKLLRALYLALPREQRLRTEFTTSLKDNHPANQTGEKSLIAFAGPRGKPFIQAMRESLLTTTVDVQQSPETSLASVDYRSDDYRSDSKVHSRGWIGLVLVFVVGSISGGLVTSYYNIKSTAPLIAELSTENRKLKEDLKKMSLNIEDLNKRNRELTGNIDGRIAELRTENHELGENLKKSNNDIESQKKIYDDLKRNNDITINNLNLNNKIKEDLLDKTTQLFLQFDNKDYTGSFKEINSYIDKKEGKFNRKDSQNTFDLSGGFQNTFESALGKLKDTLVRLNRDNEALKKENETLKDAAKKSEILHEESNGRPN